MIWFSLAVTGVVAVMAFTDARYRGFILVIGFLLVTQLQMLGSGKEPTSPWHDADRALAAGKTSKARRLLVTALSHHTPRANVPNRSRSNHSESPN